MLVLVEVKNGLWAESRMELMLGPVDMVGNSAARLKRIMARASRKRASAAFRSWLATTTCSASALSCGSPNISHQLPRGISSPGRAIFQPSPGGGNSLYAGVMGTDGLI